MIDGHSACQPNRAHRRARRGWLSLVLVIAAAGTASAQSQEPIGRAVLDARIALPKYKGDKALATGLGVDAVDLPTRGVGPVFGIHVYPLRRGLVTFGVGGEMLLSRRGRTKQPATTGGTAGPTIDTRLSSFSPQVSLNFGSKQGWSYVSGGIGTGRFTTERADIAFRDPAARVKVINYGGGARWFNTPHLALSVDLRFYAINPQVAGEGRPALPRQTSVTFSVGVGVK